MEYIITAFLVLILGIIIYYFKLYNINHSIKNLKNILPNKENSKVQGLVELILFNNTPEEIDNLLSKLNEELNKSFEERIAYHKTEIEKHTQEASDYTALKRIHIKQNTK